ncbi:TetR/AcrR family transcriptional regulator [Streptomyces albidus (ex Kaewkla and Franco 2022)]|uniref:TetR/AcrR family transcriptional regulator n=1 Tax=Streptomyces albidus (ex Kaewkla and Franco 2022) TaxID=722709 RepID=UPI001F245756|nr:TetR/AcrR family transcriptional regulator [Streptomyces albidus (ex Kaewkla and Franco 2022)]
MADMEATARARAEAMTDGSGPDKGKRGGKRTYHHGDLRNALIVAATDLARDGGPEAVVLRAAARRVGVSPTAAYRHFAGQAELLHAVKELGQQRLTESMEAAGASLSAREPGPDGAEERVRALGRGYLAFARAEPGLYRVAFCRDEFSMEKLDGVIDPGEEDSWGFRSFGILVQALDALVEHGRMTERRRAGAELTAWATVHGLATMFLDGPLSQLTSEEIDAVAERAFDTLIAGFTTP